MKLYFGVTVQIARNENSCKQRLELTLDNSRDRRQQKRESLWKNFYPSSF